LSCVMQSTRGHDQNNNNLVISQRQPCKLALASLIHGARSGMHFNVQT